MAQMVECDVGQAHRRRAVETLDEMNSRQHGTNAPSNPSVAGMPTCH
ncbi:hypothetical protein I545_0540 [Mycobacterium kansasii 662]|uniref:Uncharacterized protein n=2 Tax=Mycobacterium kansasii TaxID=1768 RepID=A0A1V3XVM2_MYCKA|nr:hypothetical protein I547_0829 [Mycobacterium kansasii 824]EUA20964.1 hypothetical protein I545_0540 [Mycobacterium kansasii 662]KEP43424.1 hypothetical protein MKSMC1_14650 [Mycobacterium kansasii]OOK82826.1 hypothetical protein BZL30_1343 [Mycobacterium kansasii]OOK84527.1 hypothetical protein BZL29_0605 [Mycobacterium kansasii]